MIVRFIIKMTSFPPFRSPEMAFLIVFWEIRSHFKEPNYGLRSYNGDYRILRSTASAQVFARWRFQAAFGSLSNELASSDRLFEAASNGDHVTSVSLKFRQWAPLIAVASTIQCTLYFLRDVKLVRGTIACLLTCEGFLEIDKFLFCRNSSQWNWDASFLRCALWCLVRWLWLTRMEEQRTESGFVGEQTTDSVTDLEKDFETLRQCNQRKTQN